MFNRKNENAESNSIIGEGSYFKGEFTLNGTLRIDGCYEGEKLEVDNVFVGQTGKIKSNIKTVSAETSPIYKTTGESARWATIYLLLRSRLIPHR